MAKRDMDSVVRDMTRCIQSVTSDFKKNDIPLEAAPVAQLALAMFDDYRGNNPRDIAEHQSEADKAITRMKYKQ